MREGVRDKWLRANVTRFLTSTQKREEMRFQDHSSFFTQRHFVEHESRKMHTLLPEKTCLPHRNARKSISVDIVLCVAGSKIVLSPAFFLWNEIVWDREPNFFSQQKDTGVFRIEIRIETIFSQLSNVVTISFRNCYKLTEKHFIPVFDRKISFP